MHPLGQLIFVAFLFISKMEDLVPETRCSVGDCKENAIYKCPRCELYYCSVGCYRRHSTTCVEEFSHRTAAQLRGQRVSEDERKRFNMLLNLNRRGSNEGPDFFVKQADLPQGLEQTVSLSSTEDEDEGDNGEDAATLLTALMDELSDDGKSTLFTVLHKAMEEDLDRRNTYAAQGSFKKGQNNRGGAEDPKRRTGSAIKDAVPNGKTDTRKDFLHPGGPMRYDRGNHAKEAVQNDEELADVLQDILEDLDHGLIDYEQALSRLPATLADDFQSRVRDGRLGDLVTVWRPWWANRDDDHDDHDDATTVLPERPNDQSLSVSTPSARKIAAHDCVLNGISNVLVSYCFMQRSMNGDWRGDVLTSGRRLWEISSVLRSDGRPISVEESVRAAYSAIVSETQTPVMGLQAVRDASTILGGGCDWVSRSLYDAANILKAVVDKRECMLYKVVRRSVKKLCFYTAWALGEDSDSFITAARSVAMLAEQMDVARTETSVARTVRFMLDQTETK